MLNILWGIMILAGIVTGALTGNMKAVSDAAIDSAGEAVTLCISMLGIMAMWTGLMNIAKKSGLMDSLNCALRPVLRFLFPDLPREHPANEFITSNMVANILGLGWAATPMGLKAMKELAAFDEGRRDLVPRGVASNEMCTFLIINISSLQLIPVNVIAYRSQYGSADPAAIVAPGILATAVSTVAAVIFCKIMCRKQTKN